jgi:hypothetical protein
VGGLRVLLLALAAVGRGNSGGGGRVNGGSAARASGRRDANDDDEDEDGAGDRVAAMVATEPALQLRAAERRLWETERSSGAVVA